VLDRFGKGFGLQHHTLSTPKGAVVDGAMAVMRECAQVVHGNLKQAALDCSLDHPMFEEAREEARKDGDDVEAHSG
jgi:hypothetical protein